MKKHSEMSVEDYRDRLGAVLTLVRIYTHDLANYLTVVQSVFGIKPYSGFFGALKLRDEVVAEFEVDLSHAA